MGTENSEAVGAPRSAEEIQTDKAAYEQLLPSYRALSVEELMSSRPNMWRASLYGLSVAEKIHQQEWLADLSRLPADKFDPGLPDLLERAARGALYVCHLASPAGPGTEAKLPAGLVRDGLTLRERMIKVLEYHVGDEPEAASALAEIRSGSGYVDLSEDLWRLTQLYREHAGTLVSDQAHYRAEDPGAAERLSRDIQNALRSGASAQQRELQELSSRAWTVLYKTYEQIAKPGRWLFEDRGGRELFVSLFTVGRRPQRVKKKVDPAPQPLDN